jgi:hypothetical protein
MEVHRDITPGACESDRDRLAHAPASARNECGPARQIH